MHNMREYRKKNKEIGEKYRQDPDAFGSFTEYKKRLKKLKREGL